MCFFSLFFKGIRDRGQQPNNRTNLEKAEADSNIEDVNEEYVII